MNSRKMPRFAGAGYVFVPLRETIMQGDERWRASEGKCVPALNVGCVVRVENLYRRRVESNECHECEMIYVVGEDSLLDKFAMAALSGLLASGYWQTKITDGALPIAQNAWNLAKAMMQTRGANEN